MSDTMWIIDGGTCNEHNDEKLYWSNDNGWVNDIASATYFTDDEKNAYGNKPLVGKYTSQSILFLKK